MNFSLPFPFNVFLLALVASAVTTALSMPLWRRWCQLVGIVDDPGHRKIHSAPVPLAGGLAVMTGVLAPILAGVLLTFAGGALSRPLLGSLTSRLYAHGLDKESLQLVAILAGAVGMMLIGLWDDRFESRPLVKFGGQFLVALLVALAGVRITLFVPNVWFHFAITILWILTVVNAFNFLDNMNGLCAGLGLIAAWYFAILSAINGQFLVATTCLLIVGALAGFFPYNFPNAKVFLGDAGSHLTGYLVAVLAILPHFYTAQHRQRWAVLTPLLVLAVPLGDLVWVVVLRWKLGQPFYVGDNNHISHRLTRRGFSRTTAVLLIWLLAAAIGAVSFVWQ